MEGIQEMLLTATGGTEEGLGETIRTLVHAISSTNIAGSRFGRGFLGQEYVQVLLLVRQPFPKIIILRLDRDVRGWEGTRGSQTTICTNHLLFGQPKGFQVAEMVCFGIMALISISWGGMQSGRSVQGMFHRRFIWRIHAHSLAFWSDFHKLNLLASRQLYFLPFHMGHRRLGTSWKHF
jgi:hypothetical protein